jgi:Arc/MetJ-type ribon-helix-helix transcriptional regulator
MNKTDTIKPQITLRLQDELVNELQSLYSKSTFDNVTDFVNYLLRKQVGNEFATDEKFTEIANCLSALGMERVNELTALEEVRKIALTNYHLLIKLLEGTGYNCQYIQHGYLPTKLPEWMKAV